MEELQKSKAANTGVAALLLFERNEKKDGNPFWTELKRLYSKKLYFELSEFLIEKTTESNSNIDFVSFYREVDRFFWTFMDPKAHAIIFYQIGLNVRDLEQSRSLEVHVKERFAEGTMPRAIASLMMPSAILANSPSKQQLYQVKYILRDVGEYVNSLVRLDFVHYIYYELMGAYSLHMEEWTNYYDYCLKYLTMAKKNFLAEDSLVSTVKMLALAALKSRSIISSADLQNHPVMRTIKTLPSDKLPEDWTLLENLMNAITDYNVDKFNKCVPAVRNYAPLAGYVDFLSHKLNVSGFIKLANESSFDVVTNGVPYSYGYVCEQLGMDEQALEHFLIDVFAEGFVSGKIDEHSKLVYIDNVKPRRLRANQLAVLGSHLGFWKSNVSELRNYLDFQLKNFSESFKAALNNSSVGSVNNVFEPDDFVNV